MMSNYINILIFGIFRGLTTNINASNSGMEDCRIGFVVFKINLLKVLLEVKSVIRLRITMNINKQQCMDGLIRIQNI